jgi:hypothetical protein
MPAPQRRPALTKAETKPHPLAPPAAASIPEASTGIPPATTMTPGPEDTVQSIPPSLSTATLSARIPLTLRDEVKIYAVRHRMSVQEVVTEAIERYIQN